MKRVSGSSKTGSRSGPEKLNMNLKIYLANELI